jgi:hypothetical protein
VPAAGIGVEVTTHETELENAPAQFGNRPCYRNARRLWQLADAGEAGRVQLTTRAIRSLLTSAHRWLTASSPTWCSIAEARGEKIVRSTPRSVISFSWVPSTDARMSSSGAAWPRR